MRRLVISVTATVLAMLGLLGMKAAAASKAGNAASVVHGGGTVGNGPTGSSPAGKNAAASNAASAVTMANDTVVATGPQIALAHGIVQVRATLVGGRLVDVTALSLPHDNPHSWDGSNAAAVKLRSEVLSKQGADVAIVSGATYTSHGYISSLQAALDAAGHH